jgi:NitT/TauT family transport system permease protein
MTLHGILRIVIVAAMIAMLEIACRLLWLPRTTIIAPSEMAVGLWDILRSGDVNHHIAITLRDIVIAAVGAIVLGSIVGYVLHGLPRARDAVEPLLSGYYSVPTFMFYPVFIILFGIGELPIIAISLLLAIVAVITATLNGLDRIPQVFRKTSRVLRMGPMTRACLVDFPAAVPYLITGIKLSIAYAFIGVIASEFILSGAGIGYSIAYAYNNFNTRTMYALMLLVVVATVIINAVLDAVDNHFQSRLRR